MTTSSSFRALQGQRVRFIYLFILHTLVSLSRGVPCSFTHTNFVSLRFTLSVVYLALDSRQQEFCLPTW